MTVLEDVKLKEQASSALDAFVTYEQAIATDGVPRNESIVNFLGERQRTWRELLAFLRNPRLGNGTNLWLVAARASDHEVLADLAKDGDRFVRRNVAANVFTPIDLLRILAKDDESIVREGVANNLAAPSDLLASMASDYDDFVRAAVRDNHNTPAVVRSLIPRHSRG
jgi:hypothetical protein